MALDVTKTQTTGGSGKDTIANFENLFGSAFNDALSGSNIANLIKGGAGADTINGKGGADILYGGSGADTFVFGAAADSTSAAMDVIRDFSQAEGDRIDLRAFDAIPGTKKPDSFSIEASGQFTGKSGQLITFEQNPGHYIVQGDLNGDGLADFAIEVDSLNSLTANVFIL